MTGSVGGTGRGFVTVLGGSVGVLTTGGVGIPGELDPPPPPHPPAPVEGVGATIVRILLVPLALTLSEESAEIWVTIVVPTEPLARVS